MNLDCPGCKSRLKLDPAKLPAGATTAVCPKCRTKILLPGGAPASSDISVQCPACSARLKVNIGRLKPGVSQSKCPKCGGVVTLPAAPAKAPQGASPGTVRLPPPALDMPVSAQTRRLDPSEIGGMLGSARPAGDRAALAGQAAPIAVEEVTEHSDLDLGRLIDQKVEGLGTESGRQRAVAPQVRPAAAVLPLSASRPPADASSSSLPSIPLARPQSSPEPGDGMRDRPSVFDASKRLSHPDLRASGSGAPRRVSEAGSRLASEAPHPSPSSDEPRRSSGGTIPLVIAGMTGGAIVSGILAAVGGFLPAYLVPRAPEILGTALHGDNVALVLLMIVTGGVAGFLGGKARPPATAAEGGEPQGAGGVSFFRFTVAAGLMGLITGVATSLLQGGFDLFVTLDWIVSLAVAGILSAAIAYLFTRR